MTTIENIADKENYTAVDLGNLDNLMKY